MARDEANRISGSDFADSSQLRMSWAALLGVEHWVRRAGIAQPDVDAFLDHAWEWSTVTQATFDDWYGRRPRLVREPTLPPEVIAVAVERGVQAADFEALLRECWNAVYGNLFGGIQLEPSQMSLDAIAAVLERYELALPPPTLLPTSKRDDARGWGLPVNQQTLTEIRRLDWSTPRET